MRKLGFLVAALSAVGVLALGGSALARRQMTVSPPDAPMIVLEAGMVQTGDFKVANSGTETIDIVVQPTAMCVNDNYHFMFEGCDAASSTTMQRWITATAEKTTLQPGEETTVNYTITVPTSGLPGGSQHAAVTVSFAGAEDSLQARYTLAHKMFAFNPIGARLDYKLASVKVDRIQFKRPLSARAQAKNDGNIDFFIRSNITVSTLGGKEVHKGEHNHVVMPGTTRGIQASWDGSPHLGLFKVKYDVVLESVDGRTLETKTIERTVLAMPLFMFVIILVVIAALVVFLVMRVKKSAQLKSARRY
ncbi:DUF916 domain-containing protein [Candidatus Saccharibacteria bacterium]|nr:DUF916 domain-containing protein [Candidatus Saccharibacteria bacterium]